MYGNICLELCIIYAKHVFTKIILVNKLFYVYFYVSKLLRNYGGRKRLLLYLKQINLIF